MKTYQDLTACKSESERTTFVYNAVNDYRVSPVFRAAITGRAYVSGHNTTIERYRKLLYTLSGTAVPDNYTANHKMKSGFYNRFVTQRAAFLLGNGVTFQGSETKAKLGKDFDNVIYFAGKNALTESASYIFWNYDHIESFNADEFVPLWDEETGALRAGIRFWQVRSDRPLRATLYEVDGITDYIQSSKKSFSIMQSKRGYKQIIVQSAVDGLKIYDGGNYETFPIVPLWANPEKQSMLDGLREQIDCYDLIKSGFANDLDDASMIYWTLKNEGGMDDVDLAMFIERMHTVKAAVVEGDSTDVQAHTIDVPYQSREAYLAILKKDLYEDAMALDTETISAGNVTATQIKAAYEPLNEATDEFEYQVGKTILEILKLAGIDDMPMFKRSYISNELETTQMILSAANVLDDETILKHLPFLSVDEIDDILYRKDKEDAERFTTQQNTQNMQSVQNTVSGSEDGNV